MTNKITASELRVGSYLFKHGEVVKIVEIGIKHKGDTNYYLRHENDNCGYWIDQFKPILLTEEILLNCGFVFSHIIGDERVFSNKKINLLINAYDNNIIKFNVFTIKYLHQLQNLYLCLVGEELNIEL